MRSLDRKPMDYLRAFLHRHEPLQPAALHLKSVAGVLFAITLVGILAAVTRLPLLMAPLGPTAVLLFAQPQEPLGPAG